MGKRLSKARRAKALNRKLVIARAHATDDSHLLQQGPVSCPLTRPSANLKGMSVPRGISLDGSGLRGKVVQGKFKPASMASKRNSINGFTADKVDALLGPHVKA